MNDPDLRMSLGGASGVVSRLMNESDLDPKAYNPEEDAHGIAQWRLDRWTRLQAKAKEWGLDPDSKEANKRFLKLEMLERPRFLKFLQDPYTDAFQAGYRMGGPEFENADSGNWAIGAEAGPGIARLPSALATGRKPFALASPNDTSIPGSSAAGAPGASTSIVRIDPLTVVHQNPWGDVLHTQTLPTHVSAPQPTNPPAQTSPATGPSTQQPGPRNLPTPPIPPTQPPPRFNWSMVTP
jgi:hypothetical protein